MSASRSGKKMLGFSAAADSLIAVASVILRSWEIALTLFQEEVEAQPMTIGGKPSPGVKHWCPRLRLCLSDL